MTNEIRISKCSILGAERTVIGLMLMKNGSRLAQIIGMTPGDKIDIEYIDAARPDDIYHLFTFDISTNYWMRYRTWEYQSKDEHVVRFEIEYRPRPKTALERFKEFWGHDQ